MYKTGKNQNRRFCLLKVANCMLLCLKILIKNNDKEEQRYTKHIVFKEVFNNFSKVKTTSNIFLLI